MDSPQIIQLLTEIKSAILANSGSKYTVALIASGSGILGASIPAIFQFFNNRENQRIEHLKLITQIKTEIITKQRQEWIDSIRILAKDLLAEFNLVYNHVYGRTEKKDLEEQAKIWFGIQQKMILIELYLNPKNPLHADVITALQGLYDAITEWNKDQSDNNRENYDKAFDNLKFGLVAIFREAWEKIKALT